jgi:hypothetical protein
MLPVGTRQMRMASADAAQSARKLMSTLLEAGLGLAPVVPPIDHQQAPNVHRLAGLWMGPQYR